MASTTAAGVELAACAGGTVVSIAAEPPRLRDRSDPRMSPRTAFSDTAVLEGGTGGASPPVMAADWAAFALHRRP